MDLFIDYIPRGVLAAPRLLPASSPRVLIVLHGSLGLLIQREPCIVSMRKQTGGLAWLGFHVTTTDGTPQRKTWWARCVPDYFRNQLPPS